MGRAGPVKLKRAPRVLVETGAELLVVKEGPLFVCSRPEGDILPGVVSGEGFYADDTRYLSELDLKIGGAKPVVLSHSANLGYKAFIDATNPDLWRGKELLIPQLSLNIRRIRLISDRLYERIEIRNHGEDRASSTLELALGADFADMFEVRGMRIRRSRGQALAPKRVGDAVRFAYVGQDELFRETFVEFKPAATALELTAERAVATWEVHLDPGELFAIEVTVEPSLQGGRRKQRSMKAAEERVGKDGDEWTTKCASIVTDSRSFNRFMDACSRDLRALMTPLEGGQIVSAGIPWYVAPFGRDSLLTCYEMMLLNRDPARETLHLLGRLQARRDDPERDAEPGKILHEIRSGELARAGLIPHTPYYGTADATPLFVMLAAAYFRWTADVETMARLRPALDAALSWIEKYGDADGDGFVEYQRRSPAGLVNQGWKDSENSIVHADGSLAEGPIALVEVQGYVYLAKQRIAEVYDALDLPDVATVLRREAEELKKAFNEVFWMPEEGTYALALDGHKRQVKSVTSNAGHCLYCDIAESDKAAGVAERLMAPDMFSGWGIRTLSAESPAYNPMSYHNGSVWPHDNAIAAAGLKRYGFREATETLAAALFEVAFESREVRLAELYCGFRRHPNTPVVDYPVACSPQAWAAAAPIMLLQSMLGISARAPDGSLTINQPFLPRFLNRVELRGVRLADSKLSLAFNRDGKSTAFSLIERQGPARVTMQE